MKKKEENIIQLDYIPQKILLHGDSHIERESRAFSCKKEPETVRWMEEYIKPGDTVFDIGANVGAYTLIMSKLVGDKGMVYAYEPNWPNFHQLNKNILLNHSQHNTVALNVAITSKKNINTINYQDLEFGSSLHTFGEAVDFVGNTFTPTHTQFVLGYSIDEFVKDFNINIPTHIKLDVDGHEAAIIKGAQEILRNNKCCSLMAELNEKFPHDVECINFLRSIGFSVISKTSNPSKFVKSDSVYNYVFAK
ncbi:MAG: FkbM family methyltransferase [Flavobacteriaceae bacterium]|nr:FkbM family methyltransferase [Flavobacteriaceae bacterium]